MNNTRTNAESIAGAAYQQSRYDLIYVWPLVRNRKVRSC